MWAGQRTRLPARRCPTVRCRCIEDRVRPRDVRARAGGVPRHARGTSISSRTSAPPRVLPRLSARSERGPPPPSAPCSDEVQRADVGGLVAIDAPCTIVAEVLLHARRGHFAHGSARTSRRRRRTARRWRCRPCRPRGSRRARATAARAISAPPRARSAPRRRRDAFVTSVGQIASSSVALAGAASRAGHARPAAPTA